MKKKKEKKMEVVKNENSFCEVDLTQTKDVVHTPVPMPKTENESSVIKRHGKCMLEILIGATFENEKKLKSISKEIQQQLVDKRVIRKARGFFKVGMQGESIEDVHKWLLENSRSKYTIFTPENGKIEEDFVLKAVKAINEFEAKTSVLKMRGIKFNKNFFKD